MEISFTKNSDRCQIGTLSNNLLLAMLKCIMETSRFLLVSELNGDPPRIDCLIQKQYVNQQKTENVHSYLIRMMLINWHITRFT